MNDRFKFRVWDTRLKEYNAEHTYCLFEDGDLGEYDGVTPIQEWYIIEQCTGMKDKNGNLIYENDRVGFYVYGQDEEWHAQQGTVIWYNSCWGFETSSRFIQFENELTIKNPKDIEIIGNVHTRGEE